MKILYKEIGQNARTHIYCFGIKIFSWVKRKAMGGRNAKPDVIDKPYKGKRIKSKILDSVINQRFSGNHSFLFQDRNWQHKKF